MRAKSVDTTTEHQKNLEEARKQRNIQLTAAAINELDSELAYQYFQEEARKQAEQATQNSTTNTSFHDSEVPSTSLSTNTIIEDADILFNAAYDSFNLDLPFSPLTTGQVEDVRAAVASIVQTVQAEQNWDEARTITATTQLSTIVVKALQKTFSNPPDITEEPALTISAPTEHAEPESRRHIAAEMAKEILPSSIEPTRAMIEKHVKVVTFTAAQAYKEVHQEIEQSDNKDLRTIRDTHRADLEIMTTATASISRLRPYLKPNSGFFRRNKKEFGEALLHRYQDSNPRERELLRTLLPILLGQRPTVVQPQLTSTNLENKNSW